MLLHYRHDNHHRCSGLRCERFYLHGVDDYPIADGTSTLYPYIIDKYTMDMLLTTSVQTLLAVIRDIVAAKAFQWNTYRAARPVGRSFG